MECEVIISGFLGGSILERIYVQSFVRFRIITKYITLRPSLIIFMSSPELESEEIEIEDYFDEAEEELHFQYSITSYGAEPMVDGVVRRLREEDIFIPDFQRRFVWNQNKASKFIESLLLGLPVPGIFLARIKETEKLLVIDGHQRLQTLRYYYDEYFIEKHNVFKLIGINSKFNGLKYSELEDEDRRRLNNSIIHATIVHQDEPSEDDSSIYLIFERLNTGGVLLSAQEIRSAIYRGELNELLNVLNDNVNWRQVFGKKQKRSRDIELILRFFALYYHLGNYTKPLKSFLNRYMVVNKNLERQSGIELTTLFGNTITIINDTLGNKAFRPRRGINAAMFDSVMVGIAKRLEKGPINNKDEFLKKYYQLLKNTEYIETISANTTDNEVVTKRMQITIQLFNDLE